MFNTLSGVGIKSPNPLPLLCHCLWGHFDLWSKTADENTN